MIDEGQSSVVYFNNNENSVSKAFKNQKAFEHEKYILHILNEQQICNHAKMLSFNDSLKKINLMYIPFNLENLCCEAKTTNICSDIDINLLIYEILLILESLHKHEIVHGDFKAKNIQLCRNNKPYIIDFDLTIIEFDDYEHFMKLATDDLHKMKLLIIQLIMMNDYKSTYTKYNTNISRIRSDNEELADLLTNKNYNLENIIEYFKKYVS
jgi:serine/threonine protein kinase